MCLAVPGKIVEVDGRVARVEYDGGLVREAGLDVVPEAGVGDYVLVHAGYAISLLDEAEALETLKVIREMSDLGA
jgi:hydrogenase expression/formation protein HypC